MVSNCHNPLRFAHTVRHLGDVYREVGRAGPARPCYQESFVLYRAHPEAVPLEVANAIHSMALLRQVAGKRDEAQLMGDEVQKSTHRQGSKPAMPSATSVNGSWITPPGSEAQTQQSQ
jgi:hypothetical protein